MVDNGESEPIRKLGMFNPRLRTKLTIHISSATDGLLGLAVHVHQSLELAS